MLNRALTLQYIREMMSLLKIYHLNVPNHNLPWPEETVRALQIDANSNHGEFIFYHAGHAKYDGMGLRSIDFVRKAMDRVIIHSVASPDWMLVRVYDALKKNLHSYIRHQATRSKLSHFHFLYRRFHQLTFLDSLAPTKTPVFPAP